MRKFLVLFLTGAAMALTGCVEADKNLGESLIDKSLLYDTRTIEFPLTDIQMKKADALSGYSSYRLTIGAIRDAKLGLTTREAAFPIIPQLDTIDVGANPTPVSFAIHFSRDTVSCNDDTQARIIQNIRVTELTQTLPKSGKASCTQDIPHGATPISVGTPVCTGGSDLAFSFTSAYAQKYIDALKNIAGTPDANGHYVAILKQWPQSDDEDESTLINRYDDWVAALPGIHLTTDEPDGVGGRINLFDFACLSVSNNYYVRNDNLAELKIHSTWKGVEKDSTFYFIPGETKFEDEITYLASNVKFDQYCFNRTTHTVPAGAAATEILVEGGGGVKPVIPASELHDKTRAAITADGADPDKVLIVKASIILPFEMPADYVDLKYFPTQLSPTIQTKNTDEETGEEYISYGGLTDASVSTENQGDIDRSNLQYAPDITYHMQSLIKRDDLATATDGDIWLLTIYTEKVANASGSLYDSDYYQQLLYASYYNSLYGGSYGYGGYDYSGYGGYGYGGYDNYYSYMMLAQMMNSSTQQSYSYNSELDKDRFYRAVLSGPASAASRTPLFRVTYAAPK